MVSWTRVEEERSVSGKVGKNLPFDFNIKIKQRQ